MLTLGSAAVVALGSWHQSEVSRWFLCGAGGLGEPVLWASGCLSLVLRRKTYPSGSIPDCCQWQKEKKDLFPGHAPRSLGGSFASDKVSAVMYPLGSEPLRALVCVYRVAGPLPVLFSTKMSRNVHFWGAQRTTPPHPPSSGGDWWEWRPASFSLSVGEAAPSRVGGRPSQGREVAEDPCSFLSSVLPSTQAPGCRLLFGGQWMIRKHTRSLGRHPEPEKYGNEQEEEEARGGGGQKPLCHSVLQRTLNDGPGEALDTVLRD